MAEEHPFGGSILTLNQVLTSVESQHLPQDLLCQTHHLGNKVTMNFFAIR